jgi:SAM-dependent methyltransferase
MSDAASARYVMGHNDRERRRLELQGSILNPFTEQLLRRAGISGGMRVLDVGCGVGDVSLIAARLVGYRGHVTAIDIDETALGTARDRAREQGLANISLVHGNIDEYRPDHPYDAVIGRHILIHTPNPLGVLQNASRILRGGGVAAFQEFDFSMIPPAYPACPLSEQVFRVFRDFFCRAVHGDIGTRLYHMFLEAGLSSPDCRGEYPIDGGSDSPFYEWIAESFKSILPRAEALGLARELDWNVDTLAQRMREEAAGNGAGIPAAPMVGGFARKR